MTAELSVAELVGVLGLPQSTVSRHLKPLRDTGLVEARREGTSVYYRRGTVLADPGLADMLSHRLKEVPDAAEDLASVRRVLEARRSRSREFFDRVAGSYSTLTEPGGGWRVLSTALAVGFSGKVVADLGAGEGGLSLLLARHAKRVTAVDQSPKMLRLVEERAADLGVSESLSVAEGDLEALPLPDGSVDAAFLSQALHHAARPDKALAEAARIVKPGGSLIILDLARHEQDWVREEWADQWLGFEESELRAWMDAAGVDITRLEKEAGSTPELSVLIVTGTKRS